MTHMAGWCVRENERCGGVVCYTEFSPKGVITAYTAAVNLCHTAGRVPGTGLSRGQGASMNFSDSSLVSKIAAG